MKKIKIVYEWIGPRGPLSNNKVPDLFQLSCASHDVRVESKHAHVPYLWSSLFRFFPDVFELTPAFAIKDEDFFVYDYQLHHRVPFEAFFTYNANFGLIESVMMSGNVLHGIKNRNGYLFLDMALESFVDDRIFYLMHNYFRLHGIPLRKVIYQTGCPNVAEIYNNYCDRQNMSSDDRMRMAFFGVFEWNMSQRHQGDTYESRRHVDILEKDFISLNYRYRPHRIDLACIFEKFGLMDKTYFTMPSHNPENPNPLNTFAANTDFNLCNRIAFSKDEVDQLQRKLPLTVDDIANTEHHAEMTMGVRGSLNSFYDKSLISVVTETNAYQEAIAETEKTFKPIVQKQPFIIVGAQHSLKYLQKKGYKTFSTWFNEDYDDISDAHDRMIAIGNLCRDISNWDRQKKSDFIQDTREVLDYNYQHFQNTYGKILPNIWQELSAEINGVTA